MYLLKNYGQIHSHGKPGSIELYLTNNPGFFGLITQFLAFPQM